MIWPNMEIKITFIKFSFSVPILDKAKNQLFSNALFIILGQTIPEILIFESFNKRAIFLTPRPQFESKFLTRNLWKTFACINFFVHWRKNSNLVNHQLRHRSKIQCFENFEF